MTPEEEQIRFRETHWSWPPLRMSWPSCAPASDRDGLVAAAERCDPSATAVIETYKSELLRRIRNNEIRALGQPDRLGRRLQIEPVPAFVFYMHSVDWDRNAAGFGDQLYRDVHVQPNNEELAIPLDDNRQLKSIGAIRHKSKRGRPSAVGPLKEIIKELFDNDGFKDSPAKLHWEIVSSIALKRDIPGLSGNPSRSTIMKAFAELRSEKSV